MKEWYETLKPPKMGFVPEDYQLNERFVYALHHYSLAEEFSLVIKKVMLSNIIHNKMTIGYNLYQTT